MSMTRDYLPSMISTDKTNGDLFPVACGSDYPDYPSFDYPNDPGYYPLAHTCRYTRQRLKI